MILVNNDYKMLDDYSQMLEQMLPSHKVKHKVSHKIKGKYAQVYSDLEGKVPVKITSEKGDRLVTLRTIKTLAQITPDGQLTAQLPPDFLQVNIKLL